MGLTSTDQTIVQFICACVCVCVCTPFEWVLAMKHKPMCRNNIRYIRTKDVEHTHTHTNEATSSLNRSAQCHVCKITNENVAIYFIYKVESSSCQWQQQRPPMPIEKNEWSSSYGVKSQLIWTNVLFGLCYYCYFYGRETDKTNGS